jgi:hypothetical protein
MKQFEILNSQLEKSLIKLVKEKAKLDKAYYKAGTMANFLPLEKVNDVIHEIKHLQKSLTKII